MQVTSILLYLIIGLSSVLLFFIKRNLRYWKDKQIAHENPHPIWGNLKGLHSSRHWGEMLAEYYKKFKGTGPFAGIYLMQRPAVVLLDKHLIKSVLMKDFNNFTDRGLYFNEKSDPLSGHLFMLKGSKWRNLRHKLTPTFTGSKLKTMLPTLLKNAQQLNRVLLEKIKVQADVNIQHMITRFAVDNISSCFFGIECNSLVNADSEFPKMGEKSLMELRHNAWVMALIDGFPKLAHLLGMRVIPEEVHQFFTKSLKDIIAYREAHHLKRHDLLDTLLELKHQPQDESGLADLSVEQICAQAFLFFMEGFETSTSLVTYALYELAQNPEIQERLRQEVQDVVEGSDDGNVKYQDLKALPFMGQVVSETLRKYPIMSVINREALNDYVVPGSSKYVIKKGMRVLIPLLGLHHDPEYYPEPEKFDPERFAADSVKERDPVEYLPFGDGPRRCFGERFGQMQSRLCLAYLVKQFRFTTCAKTAMPLTFNPKASQLVSQNVIHLRLEKIK